MRKFALSLLTVILFCGCSKKQEAPPPKPTPVKATKALSKNIPYSIRTVGHMEAYRTVDLMAQADGYLMKTYFEDGADVQEGDLLYMIDERPYLAALQQAEATLEQNVANLGYAERTTERNSQLVQDEYISQDTFDNLVTTVLSTDAVVKQNQAEVETAQINLSYTTIFAPMDARAGENFVRDGNLILENAETKLVTLNQITPIYSTFFIAEQDLPKVQRYQKNYGELKTTIQVDDPDTHPYSGVLTFIDNGVDLSTGMIKLKATVPNEDKTLWPNQYVKIELILDTIENAVLVPIEAIQTSSKGKYVFIVKGNQTVQSRDVTLGQRQSGNMIHVIKGVKAGEKVITEGQFNLKTGSKVSVSLHNEDA